MSAQFSHCLSESGFQTLPYYSRENNLFLPRGKTQHVVQTVITLCSAFETQNRQLNTNSEKPAYL